MENFVPGTLEAMGFDWDTLKALNPRLIVTRISGFGQSGPLSHKPCFDVIAQATSGLMDITGEAGGRPTMAGTYVVDYSTGLYATIGTLGALQARNRTGAGQIVDVALLDSAMSMLMTAIPEQLLLGRTMTRRGNRDRYGAPANTFATRDGGWVHLATTGDPMFRALTQTMGRPGLADDPRFRDNAARMENVEELERCISAWTTTLTAAELLDALQTIGVPSRQGRGRLGADRESAGCRGPPPSAYESPEGRHRPHARLFRPFRRLADAAAPPTSDARRAHQRGSAGLAGGDPGADRPAPSERCDLAAANGSTESSPRP